MFKSGIFDNGVLIPELLNKPERSFLEINIDFLFSQIEHKNFIINLPFFVLITSLFPVFFFTTYTISLHVCFLYFFIRMFKKNYKG